MKFQLHLMAWWISPKFLLTLRLFLNHLKLYWPLIPFLYLFCCHVIWFVKWPYSRAWLVRDTGPRATVFAENSFSLRSTPQDMTLKFLGQMKQISSQIWYDKTLRKWLSPVIYLKYCIRSPPGLDTKQTRGRNFFNKVFFLGFAKIYL